MRCAKSQKLYNIATVLLQICNGTDKCGKIFYCFIFFFSLLSLHFFFSLLSHSPVPSLLPQTPILSSQPQSVSLSPTPCFSRRRCPARPRRLRVHQDADVCRRVLRLQRFDPVAHRARFLLRPWLITLAFFFTLAFNTIEWTDWAKAAIVLGLVLLIVGVICNGVRRGAVVVWGDFVMGWCR